MPDEGTLFSLASSTVGRSGRMTRPLSGSSARFRRDAAPVDRVCRRCGVDYVHVMNSGTGSKYCADCKKLAYGEAVARHVQLSPLEPCRRCGEAGRYNPARWKLCDGCLGLIPPGLVAVLRTHRADQNFVCKVLDSPACEICGLDLRQLRTDSRGRSRYSYAVDHDHSCCPGNKSCGKCLGGLLCQKCNVALGYLGDDPKRVMAAARYLARSRTGSLCGVDGSGGEGSQGGSDRAPRCVGHLGWPGRSG